MSHSFQVEQSGEIPVDFAAYTAVFSAMELAFDVEHPRGLWFCPIGYVGVIANDNQLRSFLFALDNLKVQTATKVLQPTSPLCGRHY